MILVQECKSEESETHLYDLNVSNIERIWSAGGLPYGDAFCNRQACGKFIEFTKRAFGAEEITRVTGEDGSIGHAEVRIGDSVVMLFDSKHAWPKTPAFLRLYVDDVDAVCKRALEAGGTLVTELTNMPWGDRCCRVSDPFGNLWWIMTRVEHVGPDEEAKRYSEKQYIDALTYFHSTDFFEFSS